MHGLPSPGLKIAIFSPGSPVRSQIIIQTGSHSRQRIPSALSSSNPGNACSGCRSGAGARSSQDCRGQRQTAATPAHRLRLSLHKVRLRRPLRRLFATPYPGTSPDIRRSRSESRAGFCAMASRSARVWGGTPVWIAARTCKPCALRTGKQNRQFHREAESAISPGSRIGNKAADIVNKECFLRIGFRPGMSVARLYRHPSLVPELGA